MSQQPLSAAPQTPQDALRIVKEVTVPADTFVAWMNNVATLPAGYAADLFVSMRQHFNEAIQRAAEAWSRFAHALARNAAPVQKDLCLRLDSRWDGDAAALSATALRRIAPPYAATFDLGAGELADAPAAA